MKRVISLMAAVSVLSLAGWAYAQTGPDPSAQPSQPYPSEQPLPARAAPAIPAEAQPDPSQSATQADAPTAQQSQDASGAASGPPASPRTRLAAIVPSGMTAQEACMGFDSVSACAATLHAAQNLNLPYPGLKSKVTGGENLAAAIHDLKPSADAKAEAHKAVEQAHADLRASQG